MAILRKEVVNDVVVNDVVSHIDGRILNCTATHYLITVFLMNIITLYIRKTATFALAWPEDNDCKAIISR